ncbi:hypothetical protein AB0A63_27535 [Lentzea sp. NPDC042327]|uniref:hypothetical protein n=1 Tax=Lentzea sp. NPDC042327 TaxID=3154801 RepID=UPI00340EBCC5
MVVNGTVVVTGGTVVVIGASEDVVAVVDVVGDVELWPAEVAGAPSWAAAPVGSTGWSEPRTVQKVTTRPAVRVAATAMGSFLLGVG